MDIQKELIFLQDVTLGLLNKKGISFEVKTRPYADTEKVVTILIVNDKTSSSASYQRLQISYRTSEPTVNVRFSNNSFDCISKEVSKEDTSSYIQDLLNSPKGKENKEISWEDDKVDFYDILRTLSHEVFSTNDFFELNVGKRTLYLRKRLGAEYDSLTDAFYVNGGVGSASDINGLHGITTTVEIGKLPKDDKTYLLVQSNIAESPVYPAGMHEDATFDMFAQSVIEQYQNAWNRKK